MSHETFWTLAHDAAHWEFEIFLTVLTELFMAGIGWLFVRKHWKHHIARDKRDETYGYVAKAVERPTNLRTTTLWNSDFSALSFSGPTPYSPYAYVRPTKETYEAEKKARADVQQKCTHMKNEVNLLELHGVCPMCAVRTSGCSMCDAGIPMSRNGTTHCVDDCSHGSVGYPCEKPKKP